MSQGSTTSARKLQLSVRAVLLVLALSSLSLAQAPALPTLTDAEKVQLQAVYANALLAAKDVEIANLKFEKARAALEQMRAGLAKPGHELDVPALEYRKLPEPVKDVTP